MEPWEELATAYRRAYLLIVQSLSRLDANTYNQIGEILRGLLGFTRQWIQRHIPAAYEEGLSEARGSPVSNASPDERGIPVEGAHRGSVEILATNLYDDLIENLEMVGRRIQDALRDLQLEATLEPRSKGDTLRSMQQQLAGKLKSQGITGFIDAAGREWRPDAYANMAARTTLTEATNLGVINQMEEEDHDLVQITEVLTPCPVCAIYQGRVYSLSGRSAHYPALRSTAFSVAYHTIHPNCRHNVIPYSERYADDLAADRRKSNLPFEDNRSAEDKRAYDEAQRRKQQARQRKRKREEAARIDG